VGHVRGWQTDEKGDAIIRNAQNGGRRWDVMQAAQKGHKADGLGVIPGDLHRNGRALAGHADVGDVQGGGQFFRQARNGRNADPHRGDYLVANPAGGHRPARYTGRDLVMSKDRFNAVSLVLQ
jgi:hypothetical protein